MCIDNSIGMLKMERFGVSYVLHSCVCLASPVLRCVRVLHHVALRLVLSSCECAASSEQRLNGGAASAFMSGPVGLARGFLQILTMSHGKAHDTT